MERQQEVIIEAEIEKHLPIKQFRFYNFNYFTENPDGLGISAYWHHANQQSTRIVTVLQNNHRMLFSLRSLIIKRQKKKKKKKKKTQLSSFQN